MRLFLALIILLCGVTSRAETVHVGEADGLLVKLVIHFPTPGGSNAAGVLWTDVVDTLQDVSVLTVGTGVFQIANGENTQVLNGSLREFEATFNIGGCSRPGDGNGGTIADLNACMLTEINRVPDGFIDDHKTSFIKDYDFFGHETN